MKYFLTGIFFATIFSTNAFAASTSFRCAGQAVWVYKMAVREGEPKTIPTTLTDLFHMPVTGNQLRVTGNLDLGHGYFLSVKAESLQNLTVDVSVYKLALDGSKEYVATGAAFSTAATEYGDSRRYYVQARTRSREILDLANRAGMDFTTFVEEQGPGFPDDPTPAEVWISCSVDIDLRD